MKKWFSLFLALILTLSLWAWAETAADPTPDVEFGEDEDWLFDEDFEYDEEDEVDEDWFDDLDDGEEYLWDEDDPVEDTLLTALEAYSWFVLAPLDVDTAFPDDTGLRWRVLDERFNTRALLEDYLHSIFSDEIVENLMSMGVYTEQDGYLYASDEGRDIDPNIAEYEFELTSEDAATREYTVYVYYYEDEENETLTYIQKNINDEWKFTVFPFFW